jgi:hypothetical protein
MAAIFSQHSDSSECALCAPGGCGVEWLETASAVFGFGSDRAVGSLLHDSLVNCLLWTSCTAIMAGGANMAAHSLALSEYQGGVRKARWLLRDHGDVMLLADRGFANHELMPQLQTSHWHYCLRLPCDVLLHGARR